MEDFELTENINTRYRVDDCFEIQRLKALTENMRRDVKDIEFALSKTLQNDFHVIVKCDLILDIAQAISLGMTSPSDFECSYIKRLKDASFYVKALPIKVLLKKRPTLGKDAAGAYCKVSHPYTTANFMVDTNILEYWFTSTDSDSGRVFTMMINDMRDTLLKPYKGAQGTTAEVLYPDKSVFIAYTCSKCNGQLKMNEDGNLVCEHCGTIYYQ